MIWVIKFYGSTGRAAGRRTKVWIRLFPRLEPTPLCKYYKMNYNGLITHQDIKDITGRETTVDNLIPFIAGLDQSSDCPTIEWMKNQLQMDLSLHEYQEVLRIFLRRLNARNMARNQNQPMNTSNSTIPHSDQQNSYRETSEQRSNEHQQSSTRKRRRQTNRSHGFKGWKNQQFNNRQNEAIATIKASYEGRIDEMTRDKNRLLDEIEHVKKEKADVEKKLISNKKIVLSKTAEISVLAGRIHRIRLALPLQARLQLAEHLKVNVKPDEVEKALNALGMIRNQGVDDLDLVV